MGKTLEETIRNMYESKQENTDDVVQNFETVLDNSEFGDLEEKKKKDNDKDDDGKAGKLDPVKKDQLKHDDVEDREDDDLDNDGDTDDTDQYLHTRRKAITKAIDNKKKKMKEETEFEEIVNLTEAKVKGKFTTQMIDGLKNEYEKIKKIDPNHPTYTKLTRILDSLDQAQLKQLVKAEIKWISSLARNRIK